MSAIRPRLIVAGASLLALLLALGAGGWSKLRLGPAFGELESASRGWLWLSGVAFAAALLCGSAAWRSAVGRCGGRLGRGQAAASYGAGSLVNSFAPGWAGEAVRVALFARAFDAPGAGWTSGGVLGAVAAARALVLAALVVLAFAIGAFPLWPLPILLAVAGLAVAASLVARRKRSAPHLLDALSSLAESPRGAAALLGWVIVWTACRVVAAAALAAALGVASPVTAALLIVPALDVAGLLPILPANLGVTSGAVAVALRSKGVDPTRALSAGLALHAVELLVGISVGLASVLFLARERSSLARRVPVPVAGAGVLVILAATMAATLHVDFA